MDSEDRREPGERRTEISTSTPLVRHVCHLFKGNHFEPCEHLLEIYRDGQQEEREAWATTGLGGAP